MINADNIAKNTANITRLGERVTTSEANVAENAAGIAALGESAKDLLGGGVTLADGKLSGKFRVGASDYDSVQQAIEGMAVSGGAGWILDAGGTQQAVLGGGTLSVAGDGNVSVSASDGALSLGLKKNLTLDSVTINKEGIVAAGSKEAVSGGQLHAVKTELGGQIEANTAEVGRLSGKVADNAKEIARFDGRIAAGETKITEIGGRVTANAADIGKLDGRMSAGEANIADLGGRVAVNTTNITNIDGRVATNAANIGSLNAAVGAVSGDVKTLKGSVAANTADITNIDSRVSTNETSITNLDGRVATNETNITNLDGKVATNETNIANLGGRVADNAEDIDRLDSFAVKYDDEGRTKLSLGGTRALVKVANVAAGNVSSGSNEAVNGGQLHALGESAKDLLGGGVTLADGKLSGKFRVGASDYDSVQQAIEGMAVSGGAGWILDAGGTQQAVLGGGTLSVAGDGNVSVSASDGALSLGLKKNLTLDSVTINKEGIVAAGSKEAVSGGQLHAVKTELGGRIADNETSIADIDGRVTANETDIAKLDGRMSAGEAGIRELGGKVADNAANIDKLDGRVAASETNIADIGERISTGEGKIRENAENIGKLEGKVADNAKSITDLGGRVSANETNITNIDNRVTINETNIANIDSRVSANETNIANIDGRVTINETNIANLDGRMSVGEAKINGIDEKVADNAKSIADIGDRVAANETSIADIDGRVSAGEAKISGIDGKIAGNAKAVSDLGEAAAKKLGSSFSYSNGRIEGEFSVNDDRYSSVQEAISAVAKTGSWTLDVNGEEKKITGGEKLSFADGENTNVSKNADGAYSVNLSKKISVEKISLSGDEKGIGIDMRGSSITGLAAGGLYSGSTDAVNGDQLWNAYMRMEDLDERIQTVGAHAAALSALQPVPYNPYEPTTFSAGVGLYRGEQSVAVGVFHYVRENVIVNAGVSLTSGGDAMGRAGISFATGAGGKKKPVLARDVTEMQRQMAAMQQMLTELKEKNDRNEETIETLRETLKERSGN